MPSDSSPFKLARAVLFDHDGVLVASEPLHWQAWGELLKQLGIPYNEKEIRLRVGMTAPEILKDLLDLYRPGWDIAQYDVHALAQQKNNTYLALAKTGLKAYPGVRELLVWLRESGIRAAVVSNARRRELIAALKLLGLDTLLDLIVSRDEAGRSKPDPAGYLYAAAELGLEVSECIAVEDSPTGIEAALVAKIPSVAVLTNFNETVMSKPVPGRPDLVPAWIVPSIQVLFDKMRAARN
jgi:HAD superfamily hydrolase (TIGR01509 family)